MEVKHCPVCGRLLDIDVYTEDHYETERNEDCTYCNYHTNWSYGYSELQVGDFCSSEMFADYSNMDMSQEELAKKEYELFKNEIEKCNKEYRDRGDYKEPPIYCGCGNIVFNGGYKGFCSRMCYEIDRLRNRSRETKMDWREYLRIDREISKFYHDEYEEAIAKTEQYEY